ncbi:hypothetical protein JZ751_016692 [Albula glossodonta]|uniref:NR LBD domain-containing protein n=1 Tax=Albula glossodonta TaxID=121402 RepID=A0A8T2NSR0_9TELE|nr:hypothetical protein JZ751_008212 [Albula glossodonta]KAG9342190.1 hypothetical protein JZ751_016692 [Albula glossodonta]
MDYVYDVDLEELCPVCGDKVSGYHYAVRADRMRGGRNKFGPMYKRDRALKQQKKALIRAGSLKLEPAPQIDYTFTASPHDDQSLSPAGPPKAPAPALAPALDYERGPYTPLSSFGPVAQGPAAALPAQYHYAGGLAVPDRTIKSERYSNSSPDDSPPLQGFGFSFQDDGSGGGSGGGYLVALSRQPGEATATVSNPPLVVEFLRCEPDEAQVRERIVTYLQQEQNGRGPNERLSTFGLMCRMADQTLFSVVEWARGCVFFKELKIQHSKQDSILLVTGQEIQISSIAGQAGTTLSSLVQKGQELVGKMQTLQVDRGEIACFKFLILFNPDVRFLEGQQYVESVHEQVSAALLEHTLCSYPQFLDRFGQLLLRLPELRSLSAQAEDYLCVKHLSGEVPCNNLLIEMLHAKRACP